MEKILEEDTDWIVLHNVLTGEKLGAIDSLNYAKRYVNNFIFAKP